jgi:ABC-type bacteriocin/lantibiotic exporter with double-glycine peptidase domain
MNGGGGPPVDLPLCVGDALEHGDAPRLYPFREFAARDELFDVREIPTVLMFVAVAVPGVMLVVVVTVGMGMIVRMGMVVVIVVVVMAVLMFLVSSIITFVFNVHVELRAGDRAALLA